MLSPTLTFSNRVALARHVQGHHVALLPSNRHRAARAVDGLNSALDRDAGSPPLGICAIEMAGADISTATHVTHATSCFIMRIQPPRLEKSVTRGRRNPVSASGRLHA